MSQGFHFLGTLPPPVLHYTHPKDFAGAVNLPYQCVLYFSQLYFVNAPASQLEPRNSSVHFTMIAAFITVLAADTCCLPSCGQDKQSNYQRCGLVPAKFFNSACQISCELENRNVGFHLFYPARTTDYWTVCVLVVVFRTVGLDISCKLTTA